MFAQSFPGTLPYSESLGFLADLKDSNDIDAVTYVVAHEMAHQWWGHQLVGANTKGSLFLSESFAQYSSLMVMEKMYGKETMKKFLKHEMDTYLRSRKNLKDEPSLIEVERENSVYYNKGSIAMYNLKEYIGEENLNNVLQTFIQQNYSTPPYPTSLDFMNLLKPHVPDSVQYLIKDLFETVTVYDNSIVSASYSKLDNGSYKVKTNLELSKWDESGKERKKLDLNDDYIEIAVLNESNKTILIKTIKFNSNNASLQFVVEEEPHKISIDPRYLVIDKNIKNNSMKVSMK